MNETANNGSRTTLDQKRAAHAAMKIRSIAQKKHDYYISYVSAMPATIVMNGLGQALITKLAKSSSPGDSHRLIYDHLTDWLSQQIPALKGDTALFVDRLMQQDQGVYVRAQVEAMAYLGWLKQFARAYLNDEGGTE